MGDYIEQEDLRLRLTQRILVQMFDDDRDGTPDADVIERLIADSERYFERRVMATLGESAIVALRALGGTAALPHDVITLCVDVAEYRSFKRHPDYIRGEWEKRKAAIDEELKLLKLTELRITPNAAGDAAPVHHARGEHYVDSGNPEDGTCPNNIFNTPGGGMGIFAPSSGGIDSLYPT